MLRWESVSSSTSLNHVRLAIFEIWQYKNIHFPRADKKADLMIRLFVVVVVFSAAEAALNVIAMLCA